jgi:hypothetical protein
MPPSLLVVKLANIPTTHPFVQCDVQPVSQGIAASFAFAASSASVAVKQKNYSLRNCAEDNQKSRSERNPIFASESLPEGTTSDQEYATHFAMGNLANVTVPR